jgi:hypothetical protein
MVKRISHRAANTINRSILLHMGWSLYLLYMDVLKRCLFCGIEIPLWYYMYFLEFFAHKILHPGKYLPLLEVRGDCTLKPTLLTFCSLRKKQRRSNQKYINFLQFIKG